MHEQYMHRCLELAKKGGKSVKSNPLVGAVLVYKNRIIGEGYHEFYGGPHAEVNAINSVKPSDEKYISDATLYVSLEPCCITAKTPACTDLILTKGIKHVVVSATDPNVKMNGKSLELLRKRGIKVITEVLEQEGKDLIRPFIANLKKRPYVILKWAQSSDGYIGKRGQQIWLTNPFSKVKTHLWRSEVDGIMVGHNTVLADNPKLTTRLVPGDHPLRIVSTKKVADLAQSSLYTDSLATLFVSGNGNSSANQNNELLPYDMASNTLPIILEKLLERGITRLIVEGGTKTLKLFATSSLWDEARVFKTEKSLSSGIRAPIISGRVNSIQRILDDTLEYVYPH